MSDPFEGQSIERRVEVVQSPFAVRLRTIREEYGWTQEEAARRLQISRTQVCNLENGKGPPSMNLFIRMCNVYNVSSDWLLGWED